MSDLLDFAEDDTLAGFRLQRVELYNWGTFDKKIWVMPLEGRNALLTGEIGSGKSTLVDAVTTLMVPSNRVSYNKAAGAEFRERDLRSYVMGYYKSERSETGGTAKPVALRGRSHYSVILGVFYNAGFDQTVTLAQVFHLKESQGQPARFYLVSDSNLNIQEHFTGFGKDIKELRKQLRALPRTEPLFDTFPPYGAAFRRRFGLQSSQALELFHQTVSMKTVGNLTAFVREHMLESFDVSRRIEDLISHFNDLTRAHESVLRAKDQISRLKPLIERVDRYTQASRRREDWLFCRRGLTPYFAHLKQELLETRLRNLEQELSRNQLKRDGLEEELSGRQTRRDELKQAIAENGGDRLEALRTEAKGLEQEKQRRLSRSREYQELCRPLELPAAETADTFVKNRAAAEEKLRTIAGESTNLRNRETELGVALTGLREGHQELTREIASLRSRKSNIDSRQITIRSRLCEALDLEEDDLPFAGELLMVREEEKDWEGAAERLLRSFGLSLLVPDHLYEAVADWVDRTHLRGRLIYYRVQEEQHPEEEAPAESSLIRKLAVKPDSPFRPWIQQQLSRRFDYSCCTAMDAFRRSPRALTRAGQIKGSPTRHEKDDRHSIQDRSRFILGWRNEAKIRTLEEQAAAKEKEIRETAEQISQIQQQASQLEEQTRSLYQLQGISRFEDIHWQAPAVRLESIAVEISRMEETSDILHTLRGQLDQLEKEILDTQNQIYEVRDAISKAKDRRETALSLKEETEKDIQQSGFPLEEIIPRLEPLREEALGVHRLTIESCGSRQTRMREWIQGKMDIEDNRIRTLHGQIAAAMQDYRRDYPAETREIDATLEAAPEYRAMLDRLLADDLPQFESRFKALLNENTIREIANFQAQLNKECQVIKERVTRINQSMAAIEFNPGRYIRLETISSADAEVRAFRNELKSCTEGSFSGSGDDQYTEAKFLQVKSIIDRFKGREGSADLDRRWTGKVTDVRNWFSFAASERWQEDNAEYEHYTDSGGKSGGQKEKLAYTVLAASLAYQFGLEFGETRSRSFRFVVIDEAFGRGSDESARYGLRLFRELNLQLLIITPLQKIHIIEPFVSTVGFVHSREGRESLLRCLTIEEYREESERRQTNA